MKPFLQAPLLILGLIYLGVALYLFMGWKAPLLPQRVEWLLPVKGEWVWRFLMVLVILAIPLWSFTALWLSR
jgi:hypothetical protein